MHAGGNFVGAVGAGQGGDGVVAVSEEMLDDVLAGLAASLGEVSEMLGRRVGKMVTYADDGDVLEVVFEARGLLAGVFVCHAGYR